VILQNLQRSKIPIWGAGNKGERFRAWHFASKARKRLVIVAGDENPAFFLDSPSCDLAPFGLCK
jgi:hypothetical protein